MTRHVIVVTVTTDRFRTVPILALLQENSFYFFIHLTIINMCIYRVYTNLFIWLVDPLQLRR